MHKIFAHLFIKSNYVAPFLNQWPIVLLFYPVFELINHRLLIIALLFRRYEDYFFFFTDKTTEAIDKLHADA